MQGIRGSLLRAVFWRLSRETHGSCGNFSCVELIFCKHQVHIISRLFARLTVKYFCTVLTHSLSLSYGTLYAPNKHTAPAVMSHTSKGETEK